MMIYAADAKLCKYARNIPWIEIVEKFKVTNYYKSIFYRNIKKLRVVK